jgi:TfoX/Sxy family transcriptional regulator of competence genes
MAWIKIPAENHPLFHAAVPKDPRVSVVKMFGGVAGMVNGNMFAGLFARSVVVKLSPEDQARALALDGTAPFDPMGNGRVMKDTFLLPDDVMDDAGELRRWLARALDYTASLPGKKKAAATTKTRTETQSAAKSKAKPAGRRPAR